MVKTSTDVEIEEIGSIATWAPKNERNEKTCQHSAMKHLKQNKRAPQTHPSALAVPSYHRILVKHGLIEKTMSIPDAYEVFLKVGADSEVQKLRRKVARGSRIKHVPAVYLATAMALQGMSKQELDALKLRIEERPTSKSSSGRN